MWSNSNPTKGSGQPSGKLVPQSYASQKTQSSPTPQTPANYNAFTSKPAPYVAKSTSPQKIRYVRKQG